MNIAGMEVRSKSSPKRKAKKSPSLSISMPREDSAVTIRKIQNGYLSERSYTDKDGRYQSECIYHPTNPLEKPKNGKKKG